MKKLTIAIASIVILILFATGVVAIAAQGALKAIEEQSKDIIGLSIEVESYSISWLTGAFKLKGINIYPSRRRNKSELLASAEELRIRVMPAALLRKTLHAESITLVKPTINLTEYRNNKYNWQVVKFDMEEDEKSGWKVWVEDVRIKEGVLNYRSLPGGHRLRLTDVDIKINNIKSESDPDKLPTKLYVKSRIDDKKGTLKVKGKLNAFAEGINFDIRSWIEDAPITYFRSFYAGKTPYSITAGRINMSTSADSKKSQLTAHSKAKIYNLRVGGGLKGKLVNSFLKGKRGPVVVNATVKGNLEKGGFSTATAISEGINVGILSQAKEANPLKGTGTKIKEGTKSMGRGIKGLFGK